MFHHVIFFQMLKAMVKPWPNRSIMSWRQNWIFHGDWVLAGHCRGRRQQWQYLCSRVSEHRGGTCPFRIFFGSFSDGNWPEKKVDSDWNQHRLKHRFQWTSMNYGFRRWTGLMGGTGYETCCFAQIGPRKPRPGLILQVPWILISESHDWNMMGDLQDPTDGGTLVPYGWPYFGAISP